MRRKKKRGSVVQTLIDLTPLLDVIFLFLIVVLSAQDDHIAAVNQQVSVVEHLAQDAEDAREKAEAENAVMKEQLSILEEQDRYVNAITVYASVQPSNFKYRQVYVVINGKETVFALNPSNEEEIWKKCKELISEFLMTHTDMPAILSLRDEKMLYRDEMSLRVLEQELEIYHNLYIKNEMEAENE